MDGGQVTAIVIVAIIMVASIIKMIIRGPGDPRRRGCAPGTDSQAQVENQALREEVHGLKERLKVLERIAVEKENSLAKEIESLRDR